MIWHMLLSEKWKKNCKSEQKRQNDHKILELDNSL